MERDDERTGGEVAFLYKKERDLKLEEVDVGSGTMSEDVLAMKVECKSENGKREIFCCDSIYDSRKWREGRIV